MLSTVFLIYVCFVFCFAYFSVDNMNKSVNNHLYLTCYPQIFVFFFIWHFKLYMLLSFRHFFTFFWVFTFIILTLDQSLCIISWARQFANYIINLYHYNPLYNYVWYFILSNFKMWHFFTNLYYAYWHYITFMVLWYL